MTYLKPGFTELDNITNGLKRGTLTIVSGRPGIGKSKFVYRMFANIASNYNILLFELDEDKERVRKRIARISDSSVADTITIIENKCEGNLFTADWTYHLSDLITECKNHKQKFGESDVVIINSLQDMSIHGYKTITEEHKEIVRSLKSLAKEIECPIVLISNSANEDIISAADSVIVACKE